MRFAVGFAAVLLMLGGTTSEILAQQATPAGASPEAPAVAAQAPTNSPETTAPTPEYQLPVSLDRIRKGLERPAVFSVQQREMPTFRVEVQERNRLQDILSTLDFRGGPTPAGGLYAAEMQRVMFPAVSNPLRQPYAAFSQPELMTVIIETIAGTYLVKKLAAAATKADREAAENAARNDLRRTVLEYCSGQPNKGEGIAICENPPPPASE